MRLCDIVHHLSELSLALTLLEEDLILDVEQGLDGLCGGGADELAGLAHAVHDAPEVLGLAVGVGAGGLCAEHGGAVADGGVDVAGDQDGHVAGGGDERHEDVVLALRARHEDGADLVAGFVHGRDDLQRLQRDELHRPVVVQGQPVEGLVARQAHDGAGHGRVRDRRAVAKQVAVEEKVAAQVADRGRRAPFLHVLEVLVEVVVDVARRGLGHGHGLVVRRVRLEHVFQQLARRGLPALGHPEVGDDAVPVRAPDARHEDWVLREHQVAGRCAGDGGQARKRLGLIVGRLARVEVVGGQVDFGSYRADPSCVCIDDTTAHSDASGETEIRGGFLAEIPC